MIGRESFSGRSVSKQNTTEKVSKKRGGVQWKLRKIKRPKAKKKKADLSCEKGESNGPPGTKGRGRV